MALLVNDTAIALSSNRDTIVIARQLRGAASFVPWFPRVGQLADLVGDIQAVSRAP